MFHLGVQRLIIIVLVISLGGKWVTLQSIAWTQMLVRYSQAASIPEAVRMTFDGQHPCPLCHAARKGQEQDRREESPGSPGAKTELAISHRQRVSPDRPPTCRIAFSPPTVPISRLTEPPPKPPPRAAGLPFV